MAKLYETIEAAEDGIVEHNQADGLPVLTGSPKQITWALDLRDKVLADIEDHLTFGGIPDRQGQQTRRKLKPEGQQAIDRLRAQSDAAWWIEYRGEDFGALLGRMRKEQ